MSDATSKTMLALETSGRHGGAALLRGRDVLAHSEIAADERTAAALTPLIAELTRTAGVELQQLDVVAVTVGPGSFTGLRVGVTTAKTLAYALGCEVIGVNTLSAIAFQMPSSISSVWAVIDAQRQQLFSAQFRKELSGELVTTRATEIIDNDEWLKLLRPGDHVMGPGLKKLREELPSEIEAVDPALWEPTAESVAAVANQQLAVGGCDDFWQLTPQYFRQSAAEEKLSK